MFPRDEGRKGVVLDFAVSPKIAKSPASAHGEHLEEMEKTSSYRVWCNPQLQASPVDPEMCVWVEKDH